MGGKIKVKVKVKVKVKLSLSLTKCHAMKTYWGVEVELHAFLTTAVNKIKMALREI
jgi:hypothetical protein